MPEQVKGSLQCPEVNGFVAALEEADEMTDAEINEAVKGFNEFHAGCPTCEKEKEKFVDRITTEHGHESIADL